MENFYMVYGIYYYRNIYVCIYALSSSKNTKLVLPHKFKSLKHLLQVHTNMPKYQDMFVETCFLHIYPLECLKIK